VLVQASSLASLSREQLIVRQISTF